MLQKLRQITSRNKNRYNKLKINNLQATRPIFTGH